MKSLTRPGRPAAVVALTVCLLRPLAVSAPTALPVDLPSVPDRPYEWQPGSVFRETSYFGRYGLDHDNGDWPVQFEELDAGYRADKLADRLAKARTPRILDLDLSDAIRAEIAIEHTNPHIGTVGWFTVNPRLTKCWLPMPRPAGMPAQRPEYYHHTVSGSRVYPLPLSWLNQGKNEFIFAAGPQLFEQFGFGCLWIYDFTVRVYYPRDARHPSVRIANWHDGDILPENPTIALDVSSGAAPVERVDVFAWYDGFDESGSGFGEAWHGRLRYGRPELHVGTAMAPEFKIVWDTTWIPDQTQPIRLIARVVDTAGWHATSPLVGNLRLLRAHRHVHLISAEDIPPRFSVMHGQEKICHFKVPPANAKPVRARLLLPVSFAGPALDSVRWNGVEIARHPGRANRRSLETIDLPTSLIHPGENTFSIFSREAVHGPEIEWPGPGLLLEFDGL